MSRKSGAYYKKSKLTKLRNESAAVPGQLKISQIFSVDKNVNKNATSVLENDQQCDQSSVAHIANGMTYVILIYVQKFVRYK